MATISVSFKSALINPANFFVAAIYDASNLGTVLEFIAPVKGAGYPNPFQVTFLNSYTANKLYRVILWENTSAVVGGTSRVSGDIKASINQTTMRSDEILVYGIDAQFTDNITITDASLIGWDISFEQFGSGTLTPGVAPGTGIDYTYDKVTLGRIILVNGTTYINGQKMVIHFLPKVSAAAAVSSGVSSGRIIHTAADTLSNTDSNSAIFCQGSGGSFIATLPALSTMSDYQPIEFYSYGGNHTYVTLLAAGTDKIQWNVQVSKLFMRQGVNLVLFKANGIWNVKGDTAPMSNIGEIVYKYSALDFPYVLAAGTLLSRTTYAGLFSYASSLPSAAVTTEAAWVNSSVLDGTTYFLNKGLWTMGDGSTNFRAPLLVNQFIRGADGSTRQPGSFQADAMLKHTHPNNKAGTGGNYPFGKGPTRTVGGDSGGFNLPDELTDAPYNYPGANTLGAIISRVADETRPENISLFAVIRL